MAQWLSSGSLPMQAVPSLALHGSPDSPASQRGSAAEIVIAASAKPLNLLYLLVERNAANRLAEKISPIEVGQRLQYVGGACSGASGTK